MTTYESYADELADVLFEEIPDMISSGVKAISTSRPSSRRGSESSSIDEKEVPLLSNESSSTKTIQQ